MPAEEHAHHGYKMMGAPRFWGVCWGFFLGFGVGFLVVCFGFLVVQTSKRIILQEGIHDFVDYSRQMRLNQIALNAKS